MTSMALPVAARLPRGLRAVAWIGIALGLLGAWIALPPISARSWVWSLVVCLIAVMLGIGVIVRGERRFGGYAVASGVLGFSLGYLATLSGIGKLETVVVWSALLASTLRYATPLIFAAMGGMFSERSGVTNIGLEGMMLIGAFFGILGSDKLGQWYYGLIVAIIAGGLMALLHAVLSINLRADQIVGGTAINFLALGLTGYLFIDIYGQEGTPTDISSIPQVNLGFLDDVPFVGTVFGHLNLMIWIALLLIPLASIVLFKTPLGLRIRAVGEHPKAADTVGINVYGVRYGAVVLSGMLAACGGAYLSIGFVNSFNENMTAGRGFIALAAVIFGNWRPVRRRRCLSPVRLLERTRATAPRVLGLGRSAVPGTPVRAHVDRCCRRDRPLDPARGSRSPLSKIVRRNTRATWSVVLGVLATLTMPVAIVATRYSGSYELLHAGFAIPLAVRARHLRRGARPPGQGARSGHARPRGRGACGPRRQAARHSRALHGGLGDDRPRGVRGAARDRVAAPRPRPVRAIARVSSTLMRSCSISAQASARPGRARASI